MTELTLTAGRLNKVPVPDHRGANIEPSDLVLLRGDHPHAHRIGTYEGVEQISASGDWGCLVRFDDGTGCYVFHSRNWEKA